MPATTKARPRAVIGRISYLNTEPFFDPGPEALAADPISLPPRELARRAAAGEVDAGALPVAELFRLEREFEPLGDLGIASRGRVTSVLCFARRPFEELDGARVVLTTESSTSVRLLRLLLEHWKGVRPAGYRRGGGAQPECDAFLSIGDEALRHLYHGVPGFPHVMDLGEAWWSWQELPFVFARWAVRRTLPASEKQALADTLTRALKRGLANAAGIAERRSPELDVPASELESYLLRFVYRLGPEEEAGEAAFRRMLEQHHLAGFDPR